MSGYDVVIVATVVGFFLLAYLLLAPVYRFLKREEQVSKQWTQESLARRHAKSTDNGKPHDEEETPLP